MINASTAAIANTIPPDDSVEKKLKKAEFLCLLLMQYFPRPIFLHSTIKDDEEKSHKAYKNTCHDAVINQNEIFD
jgi:hypothetical protein